jgi:hypothetical protein
LQSKPAPNTPARFAGQPPKWNAPQAGRLPNVALPKSFVAAAGANLFRSSVLQRSGGVPAPAPAHTLAATETRRKIYACGGFDVRRKFTVTPAPLSGGIIIQKITRTFNSLKTYESVGSVLTSSITTADSVNKNANYSGWTQYWEVFAVPAGSTEAEDQDSFSLTSMASLTKRSKSETRELKEALVATGIPESRARTIANSPYAYQTTGQFVQSGAAAFYATTVVPASCKADKKSPAAGLPVSKTDPTTSLAPDSNVLNFTLTATWDSAVKGTKNWGEPALT